MMKSLCSVGTLKLLTLGI